MNRFVWVLLAMFMLSFVGATNPPTISTQPQSATVLVGQPASFTVAAAGDGLTFQWQKNGADIPGATTPIHITAPVTNADSSTLYQVKVTNDKGSVVSCMAKLTVIESGTPSTSDPICPQPAESSGCGGGSSGGGGGGGGGGGSSGNSSSGNPNPGDPGQPDQDMFKPFPITKWKGSVKATTRYVTENDNLTTVVEGDVTFTSGPQEIGLHPTTISTIEGTIDFRRDGTGGGCTDTVRASGPIKPTDGQITFMADPQPPQRPTQLKYQGGGGTHVMGTQTRACPSTNTNDWQDYAYWMMTAPDATTSPDLLVISGTYVYSASSVSTTTFEWHLVKQP